MINEPQRPSWWTQFGHSLLEMIPQFAANIGGQALRSAIQDHYNQQQQQKLFQHQNEQQSNRQAFQTQRDTNMITANQQAASLANQRRGVSSVAQRLMGTARPDVVGYGAGIATSPTPPSPEEIQQKIGAMPPGTFEPRANVQAQGNRENLLLRFQLTHARDMWQEAARRGRMKDAAKYKADYTFLLEKAKAQAGLTGKRPDLMYSTTPEEIGQPFETGRKNVLEKIRGGQTAPGTPQGAPPLVPIGQDSEREKLIQHFMSQMDQRTGKPATREMAEQAADNYLSSRR